MKTENDAYSYLLSSSLNEVIQRLRAIPGEKWEWAPAPDAPSAKIIGELVLAWLVCDRQHLCEPDTTLHTPVAASPATADALCGALEAERSAWCEIIAALTPEQFGEKRYHFGSWPLNVRELVAHIIQLVIYNSGQLSSLCFALPVGGANPVPHPNHHYYIQNEQLAHPLHAAVLKSDMRALRDALVSGDPGVNLSVANETPLSLGIIRNSPEMVSVLLEHGADCNQKSAQGDTVLMNAAYFGRTEIVNILIEHGADVDARNESNESALEVAREGKHIAVVALLVGTGAN
jgi:hypothetical protein